MGRAFFLIGMDALRRLMGFPDNAEIFAVGQSTVERVRGGFRVEISSPDLPATIGTELPEVMPAFRTEDGGPPFLVSWGNEVDEKKILAALWEYEALMEAEVGILELVYDYFSPRFEIAHKEIADFLAAKRLWQYGRFTNSRWSLPTQVRFTELVRKRVRYNLLKAGQDDQKAP